MGQKVMERELEHVADEGWRLAVVDCDATLVQKLETAEPDLRWRPECMFGLVAINLGPQERQALRRYFPMLLSRPVHHRTLLDLLVKASEGLAGHVTTPPIPLTKRPARSCGGGRHGVATADQRIADDVWLSMSICP